MKPDEKPPKAEPKSEEAKRAVVKPEQTKKVNPAEPEKPWAGGIDHFSERV